MHINIDINKSCTMEGVRVMVFNTTFNNISVILWQSVLLVEETRVPGENRWTVASHWQTLSLDVVEYTSSWVGFKLLILVVMCTDFIGSCKSNYHTITAMTAPLLWKVTYTLYILKFTFIYLFGYLNYLPSLKITEIGYLTLHRLTKLKRHDYQKIYCAG